MPRLSVLIALLPMFSAPVQAQDCAAWTAEYWEGEGGEIFTAQICASTGGERDASVFVQCGGSGELALFYDDGGTGDPPGGNPDWQGELEFAVGAADLPQPVAYQAMDGVLYAAVPLDGQLWSLLRSEGALRVTPADPAFRGAGFSLVGAVVALDALRAECGG